MPEHAPVLHLRFRFPRQPLTGLRLVQTAQGTGTWSINEVLAYEGDTALSRAGWTASVEAILDGRLASFWQSGDTLHPGQSVTIAFGQTQSADTVVVETAPDQPEARFRLESLDHRTLSADPEAFEVPPPPDLRRAAAVELRNRGIDYLLVMDGEFGAHDLRTRAADWGLREIGNYKGAKIYQLP